MTFKYVHENSSLSHIKLNSKVEVFLHLKIDNFDPDIMYPDKNTPGEFYKVRMVPATNIPFYFSCEGVSRFRNDLQIINADLRIVPELKIAEQKGISVPWKLNMLL